MLRRVLRVLLRSLALAAMVLVGLYGVMCGFLMTRESDFLFLPEPEWVGTPAKVGLSFEDVPIIAADGVKTHAWWIPRADAQWTVLYLHGNGGNVSYTSHFLSLLHESGFAALAVEYRGYGKAEGVPSEKGIYADADAAWEWLATKGVSREHVIVWGTSLGGGVASFVAEKRKPGVLVLESTFTSAPDVGARLFPWAPVRLLARQRFDTRARLPRIESPIVIAHGKNDETIDFSFGRELFESAREPKLFLELEGGHMDQIPETAPALEEFRAFLAAR